MPTIKLDDQGRILLSADLRAKLNIKPGDELLIGETTSGSIRIKKIDLRAILEGVIKEAQKVDLDRLERDVEREGDRVAREKYKIFAGLLTSS